MARTSKKEVDLGDDIPDIRRHKVTLPVQCGHCLFHKRIGTYAKSGELRPCIQLGTPASADTCSRFVPDPSTLGEKAGQILRILGAASSPMLFSAIMLSAKKVHRICGFHIGELVYLKVLGGNYLANYASGVVAGVSHDKVVLVGEQGYTALVFPDSLMRYDQWVLRRDKLLKIQAVNDPNGGLRHIEIKGHKRLLAFEPNPISATVKKRRTRNAQKEYTPRKKGTPMYIGGGKPEDD